jgi:hypothetical protein
MTHVNAMRHFRFDPFVNRSRTECTVGALRAGAGDVDVTPKAAAKAPKPKLTRGSDLVGVAENRR